MRKRFMTDLDGDHLISVSETVKNEQDKSLIAVRNIPFPFEFKSF